MAHLSLTSRAHLLPGPIHGRTCDPDHLAGTPVTRLYTRAHLRPGPPCGHTCDPTLYSGAPATRTHGHPPGTDQNWSREGPVTNRKRRLPVWFFGWTACPHRHKRLEGTRSRRIEAWDGCVAKLPPPLGSIVIFHSQPIPFSCSRIASPGPLPTHPLIECPPVLKLNHSYFRAFISNSHHLHSIYSSPSVGHRIIRPPILPNPPVKSVGSPVLPLKLGIIG